MANDVAKVLVVTNYFGFLHIVPLGNKTFYQSHNANNPDKQYSWQEMDEDKASAFVNENKGFDPNFKTSKQAVKEVMEKDEEIQRLKEELNKAGDKDSEIAKLRELLAKASTAPTAPGLPAAFGTPGAQTSSDDGIDGATKAADVIAKIQAAGTAEEVNKIAEGDTRKTVQEAVTRKLKELGV